jgi:hypothetical protein
MIIMKLINNFNRSIKFNNKYKIKINLINLINLIKIIKIIMKIITKINKININNNRYQYKDRNKIHF